MGSVGLQFYLPLRDSVLGVSVVVCKADSLADSHLERNAKPAARRYATLRCVPSVNHAFTPNPSTPRSQHANAQLTELFAACV